MLMNNFKSAKGRFWGRILTVWIMTTAFGVSATTFYVSTSDGDDSRTATQAQNSVTPWKTIAKVNSEAAPGDTFFLKCDDVWKGSDVETLTILDSITFSSYGSGNSPKLDFSQEVTGWSVYSGNIYVANVTTEVKQVYVDGERLLLSHEPDGDFFTIDSVTSNQVFVDNDLNPSADLVGANIQLRPMAFVLLGKTISSFSNYTVTLDEAVPDRYSLVSNTRYLLTNKLWMLDSPGEWYYDSSNQKLYVWLSSSPSNHTIEVPVYDNGITASSKSGFTIDNIGICKTSEDAISISTSSSASSFLIEDCTIRQIGGNGIMLIAGGDCDSATITSNTVTDCIQGGIRCRRSLSISGVISAPTISNNVVSDILSRIPERNIRDHFCGRGTGICMEANVTQVMVTGNKISNCGYCGIILGYDPGTAQYNGLAQYNVIDEYCTILQDGGGIYMSNSYQTISNNIITRSDNNTNKEPGAIRGIYMDAYTNHATITNNTICMAGISMGWAHDNTVSNNTVYGAINGLWIGQAEEVLTYDNIISSNIFYALKVNSRYDYTHGNCVWVNSLMDTIDFDTTYSNNYYAYPTVSYPFGGIYYPNGIYMEVFFDDFSEWQAEFGESGSVEQGDYFTVQPIFLPEKVSRILINDTNSSVNIPADDSYTYRDIYGNIVTFPVTLGAYSSKILVRAIDWTPRMPVMHYTFDQSSGNTMSYDTTLNSLNGTLTNMDVNTDWVTGQFGNALDFDGTDDYVDCESSSASIDLTGDMSISFWIKPADLTVNRCVIQKGGVDGEFALSVKANGALHIYQNSTWTGGYLVSSGTITTGEWQHIIVTRDASTQTIKGYYNGHLSISRSWTGTVTSTNDNILVGSGDNIPNIYNFAGQIDDVRIYDRVLDEGEIAAIASVDTSKKLHLKLDEDTGTSAWDCSGNGNNGTLTNMDSSDWVDGYIDTALDFDGSNDYVDCGSSSASIDLTGDMSISFWIKPADLTVNRCVIQKGGVDGEFALSVKANGALHIYQNSTWTGGYLVPLGTITTTKWQHIVVTRNDSTKIIKGYCNGNLSISRTWTGTVTSTNDNILVGSGDNIPNIYNFAGQIDDVRIYDRVLDTDEIEELFIQSDQG